MADSETLEFDFKTIGFPLLFVLMLWIVFWIETRFVISFNRWGIFPRTAEGLRGIITGPFIHGSLKHLFNNSVPLFVLTVSLFYFYRDIRWKVLVYGFLLTGIATWIIGRPAWHIGASGIVYMLVSFLFFKGIFSKQFQLTALALMVVFLYGGLWWYVFPIDSSISWEGHLSGFFIGFVFSLVFRGDIILQPKKYDWERDDFDPETDPFLQQFDDDGNFIGWSKLTKEKQESGQNTDTESWYSGSDSNVVYRYTEKKSDNKQGRGG